MKKEPRIYQNEYMMFYWTRVFDVSFEICGYFDNRPRINLDLFFFNLTLILPFTNKWTDECDPPKWGISVHGNTFWIYKGGKGNMNGGAKWWTWHIPFFTKNWVRTSLLLKNGDWEDKTPKQRKNFYEDKWEDKKLSCNYNYTDSYDGEVIPTTICVKEMEWRPKWLEWTILFAKKSRFIDVRFSKECGSEKGSWKGGTLGCGYDMLSGENALDCLKRMEKELRF